MISNFRQLAFASGLILPLFLTACLPDPAGDDLEPRAELQAETDKDAADADDSSDTQNNENEHKEVITGYCPAIFAPVCAELRIQCVTSPCTPARRIFSSACEAERFNYTVISQGYCDDI